VGDEIEELLALGDVPASLFDLIQADTRLEDFPDVFLLVDVAEMLDSASMPHLHRGRLRLGVEVEQDPL
jgi:hypothetical protein